jgi:hypothetical protein
MEFGQQVKEVRAEAPAELPASTTQALAPGVPDTMRELARVSPRSAVTESRRQGEMAAQEAARRNDIFLSPREVNSPTHLLRELTRAEVIDQGKVGLFHDLRSLRNQAVHAPEFALSQEAAVEYAEVARQLAEYLRSEKPADGGRAP